MTMRGSDSLRSLLREEYMMRLMCERARLLGDEWTEFSSFPVVD